MKPSLALKCFYQDADDFVVKAFKKCLEEVQQKTGIPYIVRSIQAMNDDRLYARCLDGETIYGKDSDGLRDSCPWSVLNSEFSIFLIDTNHNIRCDWPVEGKLVNKVVAKAGVSYGGSFKVDYLCSDSFNNYRGAGIKILKIITDSLLQSSCYEEGDLPGPPSAYLESVNDPFYEGNPDLFERNMPMSRYFNIKPEGFADGTRAAEKEVVYDTRLFGKDRKAAAERLERESDKADKNRNYTDIKRDTERENNDDFIEAGPLPVVRRGPGPRKRIIEEPAVKPPAQVQKTNPYEEEYYFPSDTESEGTGYGGLIRGTGYAIKQHTREQAKKLGVKVKPSTVKNKKIDVYKEGKKVASVGHKDYKDYPTYMQESGKKWADKRRELYKERHEKTRHKVGSNSYYADKLLW